MADFRYNESAAALEENLEEVLESHKQEVDAEAKVAAEEEAALQPVEGSALSRIAGPSITHQVSAVASSAKTSAQLLAEGRVRSIIQGRQLNKQAMVVDFLRDVTSQEI